MSTKRLLPVVLALSLLAPSSAAGVTPGGAAAGPVLSPTAIVRVSVPKKYANCTALHRRYPHGVGRRGARDHVSGKAKRVTNFVRNTAVYNANKRLDRDHDGIACEKH